MLDIDALFNDITEKQLDDILRTGENDQIEFKEKTPSVLDLAKQVSAFANTSGGVIVVGAREQKPQILFSGLNRTIDPVFDQVAQRVRPLPPIQMHRVNYKGVAVPVIVVKRQPNELVVSDAGAFAQIGESTQPMASSQVLEILHKEPQNTREARSADEISRLTTMLDELTKKFDASQTWMGQGKNLIVGCAGSTLSTIAVAIVVFIFGVVVGRLFG